LGDRGKVTEGVGNTSVFGDRKKRPRQTQSEKVWQPPCAFDPNRDRNEHWTKNAHCFAKGEKKSHLGPARKLSVGKREVPSQVGRKKRLGGKRGSGGAQIKEVLKDKGMPQSKKGR